MCRLVQINRKKMEAPQVGIKMMNSLVDKEVRKDHQNSILTPQFPNKRKSTETSAQVSWMSKQLEVLKHSCKRASVPILFANQILESTLMTDPRSKMKIELSRKDLALKTRNTKFSCSQILRRSRSSLRRPNNK